MRKNRFVLPFIIILLLASLPLGIYGLINKISGKSENPDKLHFYDNKLFYYDNNILIGKYSCKSTNCSDGVLYYDVNDVLKHDIGMDTTIGAIKDKYAIITDNNETFIYSIPNDMIILKMDKIKNYNTNNEQGYLLYEQNGKWGIFDTLNLRPITPAKYDYIGYTDQNPIKKFAALENGNYFIFDIENTLSSMFTDPIAYYDDNLIVLQKEKNYEIRDYEGNLILGTITKFSNYEDSIICLLSNHNIFLVSADKSRKIKYYGKENTDYIINNNILTILENNEVKEEIPLGDNNE